MPKMIYADLSRCIFCGACEVACEREHQGPTRICVTQVEDWLAVPMLCRHCVDSPCAAICPTQALMVTSEPSISFDAAKCTGCLLCMFACPFGAIGFDGKEKVAVRCDLCRERVVGRGLSPACVATCPTDALTYGDCESFSRQIRQRSALQLLKTIRTPGD
jgi:formate dehydrogenase iron-sulfur subunit